MWNTQVCSNHYQFQGVWQVVLMDFIEGLSQSGFFYCNSYLLILSPSMHTLCLCDSPSRSWVSWFFLELIIGSFLALAAYIWSSMFPSWRSICRHRIRYNLKVPCLMIIASCLEETIWLLKFWFSGVMPLWNLATGKIWTPCSKHSLKLQLSVKPILRTWEIISDIDTQARGDSENGLDGPSKRAGHTRANLHCAMMIRHILTNCNLWAIILQLVSLGQILPSPVTCWLVGFYSLCL
jgi:hypothetical protein